LAKPKILSPSEIFPIPMSQSDRKVPNPLSDTDKIAMKKNKKSKKGVPAFLLKTYNIVDVLLFLFHPQRIMRQTTLLIGPRMETTSRYWTC
jgi:hypothetical protein